MGRVVLFHGPGRPLELAHFPVPEPRGGEILVRVSCCTLCRSDLHSHAGRRHQPTPAVLGHEIVGRVEALGPAAPRTDLRGGPLAVGDRISWTLTAGCGGCFFCAEGVPQKCERVYKYGHEAVTPEGPFAGGLADFVLLRPGTGCVRVPDSLPDLIAAPLNCATATVAAVLRAAGPDVGGRTVLIFGAGVLGLTAAAIARTAGARAVLVCDPDAERRARGIDFGATHVFSTAPDVAAAAVAEATDGRGADVALELAGTSESVGAALAMARVGGTVVLAGTVLPTAAIPLDPERVVRRLLTIRGVHNYAPADLAAAVSFLEGPGRSVPMASLAGPAFPLDGAEQAFAHAHAHPGRRVAVMP